MASDIPAGSPVLKLLFFALLCLISACQNARTSDQAAPVGAAVAPAHIAGGVFRDVLKDGGEGPQMVVLPTGRFRMGSGAGEAARYRDEVPANSFIVLGFRVVQDLKPQGFNGIIFRSAFSGDKASKYTPQGSARTADRVRIVMQALITQTVFSAVSPPPGRSCV